MRLTWIDRAGVSHGTIGEAGEYEGVSISPDGERVAFGYFDPKESFNHIAMAMTAGGAPRRFTFSRGNQYSPVWSAEGQRLAFSDDQAGVDTLASRPLAGTSNEKPLIPTPKSSTYAQSWSPDGEHLLFRAQDVENGYDIHVLSLKSGKVIGVRGRRRGSVPGPVLSGWIVGGLYLDGVGTAGGLHPVISSHGREVAGVDDGRRAAALAA